MTWLTTSPWTRINDSWIKDHRIDAKTPCPPYNTDNSEINSVKFNRRLFLGPAYDRAALDIVAETVFNYPAIFTSEKMYRPLLLKKLFIILGPQHIIKFVKHHGVDTFDDIIDHSYDEIADPSERFLAAVASIEKFCTIPLETIKDFYRQNSKRFDYNYNLRFSLNARELAHATGTLDSLHPKEQNN